MLPKFSAGQVVITANAENRLDKVSVMLILHQKYLQCDWGETCEEDKKLNDDAVKNGGRILSVYRDAKGTKFWIITEHDRSYTTILLPEDY